VDSDPAVTWAHKRLPLKDSLRRWAERIEHWDAHGFGMWIVEEKRSGAVLGHCGLRYLEGTDDVELGYYLARTGWGRGFATECGAASLRFGFHQVGLPRVVAVTRIRNTASQHVLEKLGMTLARRARYYGFPVLLYEVDTPG
jgi:ribosomal-protein-alanine N-acetyltransferase